MESSAPAILPYAGPADQPKRRFRRWLPFCATLPAVVALFAPFTHGTSPYDAVGGLFMDRPWFSDLEIPALGASFFIVLPLIAWRLRLLLWRPPRTIELRLVAAIALLCSVPVVYVLVEIAPNIVHPGSGDDYFLSLTAFLLMLICVLSSVFLGWRRRHTRPIAAIEALLLGPYLANVTFCLLGFYSDADIGYWFTLIATAAFVVQYGMTAFSARRRIHAA